MSKENENEEKKEDDSNITEKQLSNIERYKLEQELHTLKNEHEERIKAFKELETEKQLLDAERLRLEQELHSHRNEIDRMREPPLVVGVIVKVLDQEKGRVIVQSTNGPLFIVNASRKIKAKKIEAGIFVSLNQRTFAIMDLLDITSEEIRTARKKYMVTEYFFKMAEVDKEKDKKLQIL